MATESIINIFTDGGCRGNPGPGGWGALLQTDNAEKEIWGGEPETTNNRMQQTAVIRALEALKRRVPVQIHTDSQYVHKGINLWIQNWKRNGWRTADKKPVKNADLWQRLDILSKEHTITWNWVKGHAGHPGNERADQLANRGIDELLANRAHNSTTELMNR